MKSRFNLLLVLICVLAHASAQISTFSNTTSTSCSADFGSLYPSLLPKTVTTSGLPSGGLSSGGTVLRQINIKLGNTSCKGNLSTYSITLVSPGTKTLTVANGLATTSSSIWIDMHFRDNSALERLRDYTTTTQNTYYPHSIGYYRVETAGTFTVFNDGTNPNGTWTLHIIENTSSEVTFESFSLVFGPDITVNDVTGSTSNNDCSGATCFDLSGVVVGTNNGYSSADPNYPGNTVNGCSWNGANNNSAWFLFQASATTAYITLSGIVNPTPGGSDTQPIIVQANGSCGTPTSVPTGGCPDDESINNSSYLSTNGGGVTTSGNVYSNGISDNCEFNLSGLTIGQKYYLYIDGNGSIPSTFYIEGLSGLEDCSIVLPVTWLSIETNCLRSGNVIKWKVAEQINNKAFEIWKSNNGIQFYKAGTVAGDGTYSVAKEFEWTDNESAPLAVSYYRIRQVDFNGKYSDSKIVTCNHDMSESVLLQVNPFTNELNLLLPANSLMHIEVFDAIGRKITETDADYGVKSIQINSSSWLEGVYLISVVDKENGKQKFIKGLKLNN